MIALLIATNPATVSFVLSNTSAQETAGGAARDGDGVRVVTCRDDFVPGLGSVIGRPLRDQG